MKLLLLVCIATSALAAPYPDVSELSGSYLPGTTGGSTSFSTNFNSQSSSVFGGSGISGISGGINGGYNPNQVQEQKHVFFFATADDEPAARFRIQIAPSSHKNTKVIFVKAPSSGGVIPEVIAPPSQQEDKTLVYVLVKKPEGGRSITIPASASVKQAKPEVYFIKYRNQHEAEQAVSGGLNQQAVGSGLPDLGNEASFIRYFNQGPGSSGGGQYDGHFGGNFGGNLGGNIGGDLGGNQGGNFGGTQGGNLGGTQGGNLGGTQGGNLGGNLGGNTGDVSGSNLLGATVGNSGDSSGLFSGTSDGTTRYGTPGASGPYKR